jgi:hypothetical protein
MQEVGEALGQSRPQDVFGSLCAEAGRDRVTQNQQLERRAGELRPPHAVGLQRALAERLADAQPRKGGLTRQHAPRGERTGHDRAGERRARRHARAESTPTVRTRCHGQITLPG